MEDARLALMALLVSAALVSGCGDARTPAARSSPERATASAPADCPNPHGGSCLGLLAAGTYTTRTFQPAITYTVPDGWGNFEDLAGNVLLVPPGGSLAGVDAGTSDYIGVYSSSAAADGCDDRPAPGVGHTPEAISAHLASVKGLEVTTPRAAEVGGLRGVVVDLSLEKGFTQGCDLAAGFVVVPVLIGRPPSSFAHAVVTGLTIRLYLLARGTETLAIEVDDVHGGTKLDEYADLVSRLVFAGAE